jgi:hypothetical protein
MKLKKLLLALSVAAPAAFAQAPIGTVVNVNGVVTATQGTAGVTVAPGTAIQSGMRFIAGSNASVTLRTNSGCTVTVPAGHGVTVLQTMTCQQLTAAVQPVVPVAAAPAVAPAGGAVALAAGALVGAAVIAGAVDDDDEPVSAR